MCYRQVSFRSPEVQKAAVSASPPSLFDVLNHPNISDPMIDEPSFKMVGDFGSPDYQAPKNVKVLKKEAADRVSALLESGESPSDDWSNSRIANLWHKALHRKAKKEEAAHDANTRLVIRVLYVGAFVLLMAGAHDANMRAVISWL